LFERVLGGYTKSQTTLRDKSIAETDARRIAASGLFHEAFYVAAYPDAASSLLSPLEHYFALGARSGYDPHPLFDTSFYLTSYMNTASAEVNPLVHYLTVGKIRSYQPNPLFDPLHYRLSCGHAIPADMSPLGDYLRSPRPNGLATHPLFDVDYYLRKAPEAADSEFTVLGYYLLNWARSHASPHPLFDIDHYLAQCPDLASSDLDPISHYLLMGHQCNYTPHPLFDTGFYYRRNPDVRAAGINPLVHYLAGGGLEGRDPCPWFDGSYYCRNNPDVVQARMNPLVHYIMFGAREGRHPHPLFRAAHWAALHHLDTRDATPLIHFAHEMARQGAHPLEALRLRDHGRRSFRDEWPCGRPGVNLIGWPRLEIGFGEYLREIARGLDSVALDFAICDVSLMKASDPGDDSWSHRISPECLHNTSLFVVNADNMPTTCGRLGFETIRDRFNIALWAWELADYPDVWCKEMSVLDEIWAFSLFNQECLAVKSKVPVVYMPQAVTLSADAGLGPVDFGIPDDRFVFLFQFDFTGFIDRKNPWASLAAFRKAFPRRNSGAALVIKTNNSERYPERMRELLDAVGHDEDIVLVNGTFRREKVMSLMRLADVFVSLHRSEGFGRSLAESMLLGIPVVATNYSGNTEFMTQQNSCPVNYTLVPVKEGQYPFPQGQVWAEADIEHAAWHMRRLFQNRPYRQFLAQAARKTIEERYSPKVTGMRYLRRLQLLGLVPGGRQ
jgi:glycosyltransferase involved in cell wall biosynthesis